MTYLDGLAGEIRAAVRPELIPDESDVQQLFLLYALLARTKGEATTAEDVHDAWAVWMLQRGETHESIRPFGELDLDTREEDQPYLQAIRRAARRAEE